MRYFGCSIKRLTSVLIRPGSVVRVHNGPFFTCKFSKLAKDIIGGSGESYRPYR